MEKRIPADFRIPAERYFKDMFEDDYDSSFLTVLPKDSDHSLFLCELCYQMDCYLLKNEDAKLKGYIDILIDTLDRHDKQVLNTDEDAEEYKCIVCEKVVNNHGLCRSNINEFSMGYGSKLDCDVYDITLCDECINYKVKKGALNLLRNHLD
jgi:hypothetical protein